VSSTAHDALTRAHGNSNARIKGKDRKGDSSSAPMLISTYSFSSNSIVCFFTLLRRNALHLHMMASFEFISLDEVNPFFSDEKTLTP
jgi:hypothetical protein